jgi:hypothetical protein
MCPGMRTDLEPVVKGVFHPLHRIFVVDATPYATITGKLNIGRMIMSDLVSQLSPSGVKGEGQTADR